MKNSQKSPLKTTAADYLIQNLAQAGLKRIYGIAGDSLNAITESIRLTPNLEWVHVRHEEVAAFAAGAEAHLTNRLTVCAGSCGPGNLHLINGLYDCHRSRVPVLAIAAQINTPEIGTHYFQETDPKQIFSGCSHFCEVVTHADQMPRLLKLAVESATAKRGVAVLVIPGDIAFETITAEMLNLSLQVEATSVMPTPAKVAEMTQMISNAKKVTILAGAGCKDAHSELIELARTLQAPIVHALRGKEFIEYDNPFDVGMTGLLGFSSGYYAMEHCDLLLMLGTDFPYTQFYPVKAKKIQVDHNGENIGRRTAVDLGVIGDIKETLKLLTPTISPKEDSSHLQSSLRHYQSTRESLDDLGKTNSAHESIHPQQVVKMLSQLASEDAIFTCDVGTPTIWAARYLKMNGKRRLVGSFNHGSMANAMPQAIGAQAAYPGRQVISLSGDGGFSMLMGDFLTLNQMDLPVKMIIFNNSALGFVELEMMEEGLPPTAIGLKNPNFAQMAEAVGVPGFRVETEEELKSAMTQALEIPGPVLIDVVVSALELSMPPHVTLEQVKGFGLYGLKAVMNGDAKKLISLVKTSFWR